MGRKQNSQTRARIHSKFESNLISGLLSGRLSKAAKPGRILTQDTDPSGKSSGTTSNFSPESRFTDSKGAAKYLGISKAKFFRLRRKGHFKPSPITGLYHLDDLDSEARGPSTPHNQQLLLSQEISKLSQNNPREGFNLEELQPIKP